MSFRFNPNSGRIEGSYDDPFAKARMNTLRAATYAIKPMNATLGGSKSVASKFQTSIRSASTGGGTPSFWMNGKIVGPTRLANPNVKVGDKVGKLVMGERGLYDPKIKALQQLFQKDDGIPVYLKRGAMDRMVYMIGFWGVLIIGTAAAVNNLYCLVKGKNPWPTNKIK